MKLHIEENSSTRVKRALFGDITDKIKTFAVLTAENPMGAEFTRSVNRERMDRLKKELALYHIQYTKIKGNYGNKENSLMLYNLSYKDALHFASEYGQESFFFARNDFPAIVTYYQTAYEPTEDDDLNNLVIPPETYEKKETSRNISNEKDAEDFFSRHGDFKFKFDMDYFKESAEKISESIVNPQCLRRATSDNFTAHGRIMARIKSIKG